MSGKSTYLANAFLNALFNGTGGITGLFLPDTSGAEFADLYISLHTTDPGPGGNQATAELSYTPYARVAVARLTGGFTVSSAGILYPTSNLSFPTVTSGAAATAAFMGIGTLSTGGGVLLYSGPISPLITIGVGLTPILTTSTSIGEN